MYGTYSESTELTCTFYGNPEPTITWSKLDGGTSTSVFTPTSYVNDTVGSIVFVTSTYTVTTTELEDYGTYSCEASNAYGTTAQNVTLHVYCKSLLLLKDLLLYWVFPEKVRTPLDIREYFYTDTPWISDILNREGGTEFFWKSALLTPYKLNQHV